MSFIRKLQAALFHGDVSTFVAPTGTVFFDQTTTTFRFGDGSTPGGIPLIANSSLPSVAITYSDIADPANDGIGNIFGSGINAYDPGAADILFTVTSSSSVTASGITAFYSGGSNPYLTADGLAATGANGARINTNNDIFPFMVVAWATNSSGTAYSAPSTGTSRPMCLAEGTSIALSNGNYKNIENITYEDNLLVWDFDRGCYTESKPLWIMKPTLSPSYNALVFDDDSFLYTVGQHRIFNKETGSFTYPLTDDTPLGTTTFNQFGKEVTLIEKHTIQGDMKAYNIITEYHMNLFANGILTSTGFNNIYPIVDMKFVKNNDVVSQGRYQNVSDKFYHGLRLSEQNKNETTVMQRISGMLKSELV